MKQAGTSIVRPERVSAAREVERLAFGIGADELPQGDHVVVKRLQIGGSLAADEIQALMSIIRPRGRCRAIMTLYWKALRPITARSS